MTNTVEVSTKDNTQHKDSEMLQCRKCGRTFHQSKVKRVHNERMCPHCSSKSYGLIDYPVDEEFNTYKSRKFWSR